MYLQKSMTSSYGWFSYSYLWELCTGTSLVLLASQVKLKSMFSLKKTTPFWNCMRSIETEWFFCKWKSRLKLNEKCYAPVSQFKRVAETTDETVAETRDENVMKMTTLFRVIIDLRFVSDQQKSHEYWKFQPKTLQKHVKELVELALRSILIRFPWQSLNVHQSTLSVPFQNRTGLA